MEQEHIQAVVRYQSDAWEHSCLELALAQARSMRARGLEVDFILLVNGGCVGCVWRYADYGICSSAIKDFKGCPFYSEK